MKYVGNFLKEKRWSLIHSDGPRNIKGFGLKKQYFYSNLFGLIMRVTFESNPLIERLPAHLKQFIKQFANN